ncbi:Retinol Dehydrogenase [Gracilaria domingensis]|nr:Retinol Dehydrogenase [Gracilaria domingensis]
MCSSTNASNPEFLTWADDDRRLIEVRALSFAVCAHSSIMPQSTIEYLVGFAKLTIDTLSQRFVNPKSHPHALFQADETYLQGKLAVVTGANTGIGLQTARMLAAAGANVILACRNLSKAKLAADGIRESHPAARVEVAKLDLSCLQSVREFAKEFGDRACDMLVLNAGIMGADSSVPEAHFMVNHSAHALLALLLLGNVARVHGRIVFISSLTLLISDLHLDDIDFANRPYKWMTAYANSKLSMVLFMRALHKRVGHSVVLNAVHPGEATSDVARYLGKIWMTLHQQVGKLFLLSVAESARTSVFVAGAVEAQQGGNLFHRVDQLVHIPSRLVTDADVECLWEVTLAAAEVKDCDLDVVDELMRAYILSAFVGLYADPFMACNETRADDNHVINTKRISKKTSYVTASFRFARIEVLPEGMQLRRTPPQASIHSAIWMSRYRTVSSPDTAPCSTSLSIPRLWTQVQVEESSRRILMLSQCWESMRAEHGELQPHRTRFCALGTGQQRFRFLSDTMA